MVAHPQHALGPETAPQAFGDLGQSVAGLCQRHQPLAGVVRQTVLEDAPGGLGFGVLAAQTSVELPDGGPFLEVLAGVLVQGFGPILPCYDCYSCYTFAVRGGDCSRCSSPPPRCRNRSRPMFILSMLDSKPAWADARLRFWPDRRR